MNTDHSDTNENLLGKYLAQETDAYENALIKKWLQENETNQKELDDYSFIWEKTSELKRENVDVEAAWVKVKSKMDSPVETKTIALRPTKQPRFFTIGIAASIIVILTVGVFAYFFSNTPPELISIKTTQHTLEQKLPDGSIVFLNMNTSLTYPEDFKGDMREITLSGEAFFDIQKDETKPFIIHANGTDVKVLGTSFNVKAYTKNVEVSVETGKVEFKGGHKATLLLAGEQAAFEAENDTIKKHTVLDKNTYAYKTKVFVFDNSSLEDITKVLAEGYHVSITLRNDRIKTCRLTTKFDNETLSDALSIIAETLNLSVSTTGKDYVLDGEGCAK